MHGNSDDTIVTQVCGDENRVMRPKAVMTVGRRRCSSEGHAVCALGGSTVRTDLDRHLHTAMRVPDLCQKTHPSTLGGRPASSRRSMILE